MTRTITTAFVFTALTTFAGAHPFARRQAASNCSTTLQSVATNAAVASCLDPAALTEMLSNNGQASLVPQLSGWLDTICSAAPCSNDTLRTAYQTIFTACRVEFDHGGPGRGNDPLGHRNGTAANGGHDDDHWDDDDDGPNPPQPHNGTAPGPQAPGPGAQTQGTHGDDWRDDDGDGRDDQDDGLHDDRLDRRDDRDDDWDDDGQWDDRHDDDRHDDDWNGQRNNGTVGGANRENDWVEKAIAEYPTFRKVVCLRNGDNYCVTETLNALQGATGVNLTMGYIRDLLDDGYHLDDRDRKLPTDISCSPCMKATYNTIKADRSWEFDWDDEEDLRMTCGANFTDGTNPVGITQLATESGGGSPDQLASNSASNVLPSLSGSLIILGSAFMFL
ncbi:hypothetical protein V5O48_002990 [Marasmius crinis-equi]|uniref:Uncharacterized protein n=1 Tax=Marasmius crinis-equi TaxID=585013 RepID=A0ABR3FU32_9AGAR